MSLSTGKARKHLAGAPSAAKRKCIFTFTFMSSIILPS
jgi:hypothetical protein